MNQYNEQYNFNKESKEVLEEFNLPILKTTLKSRIAYAEAVALGKGVYEYKDPKAKSEIVTLTNEVLYLLST